MTSIDAAVRLADQGIYTREDRSAEPKEMFKALGRLLFGPLAGRGDAARLCDVGCASGDFLHYARQCLPQAQLHGTDVLPDLLELTGRKVPGTALATADLQRGEMPFAQMDLITVIGVIQIFDDPGDAIRACINALAPGGCLALVGPFNAWPIDVITRYRRAGSAAWELGWNIHALGTVEAIVGQHGQAQVEAVHSFTMPFALAPRADDPMRTWTFADADGQLLLRNGASQLIDIRFVLIRKPGLGG